MVLQEEFEQYRDAYRSFRKGGKGCKGELNQFNATCQNPSLFNKHKRQQPRQTKSIKPKSPFETLLFNKFNSNNNTEFDNYRKQYRSYREGNSAGCKGELFQFNLYLVADTTTPSSQKELQWNWKNEENKITQKCSTIGIFDSGIGGLTVYIELKKKFPNINIIYFADTQRQPYGSKPQKVVAKYCEEIMLYLQNQGAELIIIACNTATAAVFDNKINEKEIFQHLPIFGTIPFAVERAKQYGNAIGVIATEATCTSNAYARALGMNVNCLQMPCPEFMPLIEQNKPELFRTRALQYLMPCQNLNIQALILGCTHYPILADIIADVLNEILVQKNKVVLVDPAVPLVEKVMELLMDCGKSVKTRFCVNQYSESFVERASFLLQEDVKDRYEVIQLQGR